MPLLALATCANLPSWEIDDRPLHEALGALGARVERPVWDDPAVRWERYDACLIRTTWDYMEKRPAYLAWAEAVATATALWNPATVVRWNTDKRYLRDMEARGVPVIPTLWLERGGVCDLRRALAERGWRAGFIKPAVGATARETMPFAADGAGAPLLHSIDDAQAHLHRLLGQEAMLVQPWLGRVTSDGERSAIFIDGALTHAVRKVPVPGDYRVQDDFGGRDAPTRLRKEELDIAEQALAAAVEALGLRPGDLLYARVDLLRDDAGESRVSELELVEPSLFFRHSREAAQRLAEAVVGKIRDLRFEI